MRLQGRYSSFPRTAWVSLLLAAFNLLAGVKLARWDGAWTVAPWTGLGVLAFLVWPAMTYGYVGHFIVDERGIRGRRRMGFAFDLAWSELAGIEISGSKKFDNLGVRVRLRSGKTIQLTRITPSQLVERLAVVGRPKSVLRLQTASGSAVASRARS